MRDDHNCISHLQYSGAVDCAVVNVKTDDLIPDNRTGHPPRK